MVVNLKKCFCSFFIYHVEYDRTYFINGVLIIDAKNCVTYFNLDEGCLSILFKAQSNIALSYLSLHLGSVVLHYCPLSHSG